MHGKLAVSSTKSMTGHLLGGAGGLEAGFAVLAIRDQIIHPLSITTTPDPDCDLDYVPNRLARPRWEYVLSKLIWLGDERGIALPARPCEACWARSPGRNLDPASRN